MRMNIKIFVVWMVVVGCALAAENRNITMPDGVFEVDYSNNQVYLGAMSKDQMEIFNGHTGASLQTIPVTEIEQDGKFTSFAFSLNNQLLALGLDDGSAHLYTFNATNNKFERANLNYTD